MKKQLKSPKQNGSMTTINKKKMTSFRTYLEDLFPVAHFQLDYTHDYELVIVVMLSAQTTDKSVNLVTPTLFGRFPTLKALKEAPIKDIEEAIKTIGLYRNKARHIKNIATIIDEEFNGVVPSESELLMRLPGVGNKTRNVIQAELFNIPSFAVDTHVMRISKRLGFAKEKNQPDLIEMILKGLMKPQFYNKVNHQMIMFGRNICLARSPKCQICKMKNDCLYFLKNQK